MTAARRPCKRVFNLERNSGNLLDGLIIFNSVVWPNSEGKSISKLSHATGVGWRLNREDGETEEAFEHRERQAARQTNR